MAFNVLYNIIGRDKFSRSAKNIKKSSGGLKRSFGALGKQASELKTKLMAFATVTAVVVAFRTMIKIGGEFQDSMADLSAITGATGDQLKFYSSESLRMAKASGVMQKEVARAFTIVASGKSELLDFPDKLAGVTEQVLLLKNAAGIDLASAAATVTESLNIFGAEADQAGRFVNVLAAGAKFGASEIADTSQAVLLAGPAARAAGLSFEQLNAAIQTVAKGGIKGARAGTALNAIFGRLQRSGSDFAKEGLQGAFSKIKIEMESLTSSTDRALFVAKKFGDEHSKVGLAILANVGLLDKFKTQITGTDTAQDQANIRLGTFNAKAKKTGIILKEGMIRAFNLFEPLLSGLLDLASFVIPKIGTLLDMAFLRPLKVIGTILGSIIASIATFDFSQFTDLFGVTGKLANIISGVDGQVSAATTAQTGQDSKTTVDVNINAPDGTVKSTKAKSTGKAKVNVGTNMILAAG